MKCPVCKAKINELDEICPNCKANFDDYEKGKKQYREKERKTNADYLSIFSVINLIITIIGSIIIWINFSTTKIVKEYSYISGNYTETIINWYGIIGGIALLIVGFTIFFLLRTIIDIYYETIE